MLKCAMVPGALFAATLLAGGSCLAQAPAPPAPSAHHARAAKPHAHPPAKKKAAQAAPVAQTPAPPPMPHWPINDNPNPAAVVWDANGLRINATNSSLQQILNEVSTDTGTKVVGSVPDQRIYGSYGPGQAGDVLSQLLQGSGYNVLLAGDIGHGAPSEIVLSPRRAGSANAPNTVNRQQQQDPDEDIPDEQPPPPEEQPQPQVQQPPNQMWPGFGPNGPIRTPQQVMEEMQQRQLLQQQQMQEQQQNNTAPQSNPQ